MATQNFKPILFSTEMVQAILAGRKTQTRRVIKPQPQYFNYIDTKENHERTLKQYFNTGLNCGAIKAKYQKGDILWVRETFIDVGDKADEYFAGVRFHYKTPETFVGCWSWKPSIHMPKEVARIFLKVTDVRAERLQDISEEDAVAEGIDFFISNGGVQVFKDYTEDDNYFKEYGLIKPSDSFHTLWYKINSKKHTWESNPWVWVYTFERIEKPENFK